MRDHDYKPDSTGCTSSADELDAALAKYAAVEPRAGLEERILAGLKAEREHVNRPAWWRWPAWAAVTALVIVALALGLKPKKSRPEAAHHPLHTEQRTPKPQTLAITHEPGTPIRHSPAVHRRHAQAAAALIEGQLPRLEEFPSPQPLSQQEQMLVRYVADYPERAALIAQARAELLSHEAGRESGNGDADHSQEKFQ